MANQRYFTLPSGDVTQDIDYHIDSWRQLGGQVEKILDVRMVGFNPGFLFAKGEHTMRMPVSTVQTIVAKFNELQRQLDQVKDVLMVVQDQLHTNDETLPDGFDRRVVQWVDDAINGTPPNLRS